MSTQISREEYEELLKEVRELKKSVEELIATLRPLLFLVEKIPEIIVDPGLFKSAAPILALPYALERANLNVLGASMIGGIECASKSLETIASMEKPPQLSLLKLLTDKETKEALGLLIEILKKTVPCLHRSLRQYATP